MSAMIRKVYEGFSYRPDTLHFHPIIGIFVLVIQFFFLLSSINFLLLVLLFVISENCLYGNFRGTVNLARTLLPLLFFLGGITFIFGGLEQSLFVILRLIVGGLAFSFYFKVTNPSDLARSLERIGMPSRWAMIPCLALTMVPRVAKDAEETFEALALRGEIQGFFYSWLPRTLAIFIASVIYRSEFLSQSLYYRGFGVKKRTHYRSVKINKIDLFRIGSWVLFSLIVFLYLDIQ